MNLKILLFTLEICCSDAFCFCNLLEKDESKKSIDLCEFKRKIILGMVDPDVNSISKCRSKCFKRSDEARINVATKTSEEEELDLKNTHLLLSFKMKENSSRSARMCCFFSCELGKTNTKPITVAVPAEDHFAQLATKSATMEICKAVI